LKGGFAAFFCVFAASREINLLLRASSSSPRLRVDDFLALRAGARAG